MSYKNYGDSQEDGRLAKSENILSKRKGMARPSLFILIQRKEAEDWSLKVSDGSPRCAHMYRESGLTS